MSPCWGCHGGQVPLPVWPACIPAVLTLSSKASQVDTISRTSGVHSSCLYSASWDDRLLFPLSLLFTAICLGRSCPAQPSPMPPLWEVSERGFYNLESKGGDGILPQMIEMFQGTFPKMTIDMWEENQECFLSDCQEFVEFVSLRFCVPMRVCLCEYECPGEEIQCQGAQKEGSSWEVKGLPPGRILCNFMGWPNARDHFNSGRGQPEPLDWLARMLEQVFIGIEVGSDVLEGCLQCLDIRIL